MGEYRVDKKISRANPVFQCKDMKISHNISQYHFEVQGMAKSAFGSTVIIWNDSFCHRMIWTKRKPK